MQPVRHDAEIIGEFNTGHQTYIHDISYDFYGKRLALCSSDQKISIWDVDDNGKWVPSAKWKAHSGSIFRVCWAHPEFGQIIASCSRDKMIEIWEEPTDRKPKGGAKEIEWTSRCSLVDARDEVEDVKFAPHHLGLKLASASKDGMVRIYEAIDPMNLNNWPLTEEFEAQKSGGSSIAWNPARFDPPTILVGGVEDPTVKIWQYKEEYRRWQVHQTLQCQSGIRDVAWAPNMGRSYHYIAAALMEGHRVAIWKLAPNVEPVVELLQHDSEVWRVEWNVTGTILATSSEDGSVRMWKADLTGGWKEMSNLSGGLPNST